MDRSFKWPRPVKREPVGVFIERFRAEPSHDGLKVFDDPLSLLWINCSFRALQQAVEPPESLIIEAIHSLVTEREFGKAAVFTIGNKHTTGDDQNCEQAHEH